MISNPFLFQVVYVHDYFPPLFPSWKDVSGFCSCLLWVEIFVCYKPPTYLLPTSYRWTDSPIYLYALHGIQLYQSHYQSLS
jgi:hypothetical protein